MIKGETKFWHEIKTFNTKNNCELSFTRVENSAAHGTPDLLGYNTSGHFFTVELKLKTLIRHNVYFQLKDSTTPADCAIHYLKKGSGIGWHDDGTWKYGATYYINHKWNKQWGGEFMFTDNNGHGWIPPIGNSLVVVKAPIPHKVNPVLSPVIPRITVQMFMK